jgi:hypothetical protein
VGLKKLGVTEENKFHLDNSVKQQMIYEITINTTCIYKKKQQTKKFLLKNKTNKLFQKNHKISIRKKKDYNY